MPMGIASAKIAVRRLSLIPAIAVRVAAMSMVRSAQIAPLGVQEAKISRMSARRISFGDDVRKAPVLIAIVHFSSAALFIR